MKGLWPKRQKSCPSPQHSPPCHSGETDHHSAREGQTTGAGRPQLSQEHCFPPFLDPRAFASCSYTTQQRLATGYLFLKPPQHSWGAQWQPPAEASDGLPLLKASVTQPGCTVATILGVAPWGAMEGDRSEGVSANGRAWARGLTKSARLWELLREER